MAKLNSFKNEEEGEEDLPDLATILQNSLAEEAPQRMGETNNVESRKLLQNNKKHAGHDRLNDDGVSENESTPHTQKAAETLEHRCTKSPLPTCSQGLLQVLNKSVQDGSLQKKPRIRSTPKRAARKPVDYSIFSAKKGYRPISISEDDDSFTDLSGFIVPDSESDSGDHPRKAKSKRFCKSSKNPAFSDQILGDGQATKDVMSLSLSSKIAQLDPPALPSRASHLSFKEIRQSSAESLRPRNDSSRPGFSPLRSSKPSRMEGLDRPMTPPSSPSKSVLGSPSKKYRIPPSPHRPSIDAFWSQDVINDWNDQYSPRKPPHTPGRNRPVTLEEDDEIKLCGPISPQKSPTKSPSKRERQNFKVFQKEKANLGTTFLIELDEKITNNKISNLTDSTGGIKLVWSKKLSSTAGRANWRREAVRHKNSDGTYSEMTYRHHASIELAEKVIDCEDRLINVMAHEFCHLANFMIPGVKDQPHGKEFKTWAAKVTDTFKDRGVEVTTKHGYDITYKYVWTCRDCGLEYKRHSKSIDPTKHSCGICKGKLVQILPAPRKESEYQQFVKANWDKMRKKAGQGARMGDINGLLAKEWENKKLTGDKGNGLGIEVADVTGNASDESDKMAESHDLDQIARKLDFLSLEA